MERGGNKQEMKAAGWEAAGDPHPAPAAPLLCSGGPQGLHLAFILQAKREVPPNESRL